MPEIIKTLPQDIIAFILNPPDYGWLLGIKVAFIIFSLFLIGLIIFTLHKTSWLKYIFLQDAAEIVTYRPFGVKKIEKDWRKIIARLNMASEPEQKLAVIEADNIMNETLKRMGFAGNSLAERLTKLTSATLPNIEDLQAAHKVRDKIVHDPNYGLSLEETKNVLGVFEKALRDLDAF